MFIYNSPRTLKNCTLYKVYMDKVSHSLKNQLHSNEMAYKEIITKIHSLLYYQYSYFYTIYEEPKML